MQRGAEPRPKTNLVYSKAVRNPLVVIILSIPKCMFYSKTIRSTMTASVRRPKGEGGACTNPPLVLLLLLR